MQEIYHYEVVTPDEGRPLTLGVYEEDLVRMGEQIFNESPIDPWADSYKPSFGDLSAVVVALNSRKEVVGFGSLIVEDKEAELDASFVRAEDRGMGIYKEMTRLREEIAREMGASKLRVVTMLSSLQAPFLLRTGFCLIEGEDNIYEKDLVQREGFEPSKVYTS